MKNQIFRAIIISLFLIFLCPSEKGWPVTNPKTVYLTFDDGPSVTNTMRIMDIMNENDVKGTFFIVGSNAKSHPEIVRTLYLNDMDIEPHCNSHKYGEIYSSPEKFFEDYKRCLSILKEITGCGESRFLRMPGGSDNRVGDMETINEIKTKLRDDNIYYVDWNVSSGDASAYRVPADTIISNVQKYSEGWNTIVVLMHDAEVKTTTPEALPYIIRYFKERGYVFKTFNDISDDELQHMIRLRIINR